MAQDRPWRVGAVFDNTGTADTGRTRLGDFFQHANVAERDHVATLQYVTSPTQPDDVTIAALNYRVPLPAFGDSLDLYGIYASVDAGVVSELFSVRGRGRVLGLRYTQNLRPSATWRHRLLWGVEQRPIDNEVGMVDGSPDLAPDITLHPASLGYAGSWTEPGRQVELSVTGVHNLPRGSRGNGEAFAAARAGGQRQLRDPALRPQGAAGAARRLAGARRRSTASSPATPSSPASSTASAARTRCAASTSASWSTTAATGRRSSCRRPTSASASPPASSPGPCSSSTTAGCSATTPLPGEVTRSHIASAGAGLRLSLPPSWNLRVDVSRVAQGTEARPRGSDRIGFSIGYAY